MKIFKPALNFLQRKYLVCLFLAGGVLLLSLAFSGRLRSYILPAATIRSEQEGREIIIPRVEGDYIVAASSSSRVQFAPNVNVQVKDRDLQADFSLASSTAARPAIADDQSVVYQEAYPGVDVHYQIFSTKLKEDIIVKDKKARTDFTYDLKVPAGASLQADPKGGIRIVRDKQLLFYVEPLKVTDKSGNNYAYEYILPQPTSQPSVQDSAAPSTVRLSLRPINAADLAKVDYPLIIDPTMDWSIISISPDSGPIAGGTSVTLSGSNLSNNWPYRKRISIDETKIPGTAGLSNFTVLVSLTDANLKSTANGGHVGKANGGDIKFTLADGITKLNHELKKYDPTTGQLVAWVNVPYISATANTDLYMYFGNAAASDQGNASSTWSQYRSVWHMDDNNYSDTFTGTTLDANKWTAIGVGSVSQNERVILSTGSGQWSGAGVSSADKMTFKGDFDIQVDFDASAWGNPKSDGFDAEIELWSGSRAYIQTYHRWSNGSKAYGNWQTETNAGWGSTPATTATSGKLRMVRVGSTITSYYWNGSAWVANGSFTGTYSNGEMYVNLAVSNRGSGTALPATYIDNFIVNSGDSITDTTAKNNGLNSGSSISAGKIGGAHYFNGTNSFVSVPYSSTLDMAAGDFSVETWINSTQAQVVNVWPTLISNEGADGTGKRTGYDFSTFGSTSVAQSYFTIYSNDAQYNAMGLNIRDGAWHHVVLTKTSSQIKIYIDGVLVNTSDHNLSTIASTRATQIGRYAGSNSGYFAGNIDELWLNNSAVSADWVAAEYANQNSPSTFYSVGAEEPTTQVIFGGAVSANAQYISSTTITAVAPAHDPGAVDVVVANSDGQTFTVANGFTYIGSLPPTISSITPAAALRSGGDTITINGSHFVNAPTVYFGAATSSSVTFVSSSTLSVVVPPAVSTGNVDIKVVNPDGQSATLTDAFTYQDLPPTITGITPDYGSYAGGTSVTITGTHFFDLGNYRQAISITNPNSTNLNDYQLPLTVDTQTLISQNKMKADGGDLRFIDNDTQASLPYWLESGLNTTSTKIWIKVNSIPTTGKSISLIYGNSANTTLSSTTPVFIRQITGTVAIYNFDETSGNAFDFSGNSNTATPSGTSIVSGKFGQARSFNGSSDYLNIVNSASTNFGSGDFSLQAWVKTTATGNRFILDKTVTASPYQGYVLELVNNHVRLQVNDDSASTKVEGGQVINDGNWHLVTAVRTGSTAAVYVDGVLDKSGSVRSGSVTNSVNLQIGQYRSATGYSWSGVLDEVLLFNRALSANEITDYYNNYGYISANTSGKILVSKIAPTSPTYAFGTESSSVAVSFSGVSATNINVVSSSTITAITPAHSAGSTDVVVANPDSQSATLTSAYTFVTPPTISSITPAAALRSGGDTVTINGSHFVNAPTVYFGAATSSSVTFVSSSTLSVVVPPAASTGNVDIKVVNPDGQSATLTGAFTYQDLPPTITGITPDYGSYAGGTSVTITGTDFKTNSTVGTGGTISTSGPYTIHVFTSNGTFYLPQNRHVDVLAIGGGGSGGAGAGESEGGGSGGGSGYVVAGTYSISGSVTVNVGSADNPSSFGSYLTAGAGASGLSGYSCPPYGGNGGSGGGAGTRLQYGGGGAGGSGGSNGNPSPGGGQCNGHAYTGGTGQGDYSATLAIFSGLIAAGAGGGNGGFNNGIGGTGYGAGGGGGARRSFGDAGGGAGGILVNGTGPVAGSGQTQTCCPGPGGAGAGGVVVVRYLTQDPANITFGGVAATNATVVNSTTITAITPAHSAGSTDVVITNPSGQSASLTNGFTYLNPPTISSLSQTEAIKSGGGTITITGSNYFGTPTVYFGSSTSSSVALVSSSTLSVVIPAVASAGNVDIKVVNPDGQLATLANGFLYLEGLPIISHITPSSGAAVGGTAVSITGSNFMNGAQVFFGGVAATNVVVASSSSITLNAPAHDAGQVDVVITNPDGHSVTSSNSFSFLEAPQISSINPHSILQDGYLSGAIIRGNYFQSGAAVVLRLPNQADLACSNYQFIDSQTISCDFNFQGLSYGQYNLVIINPDNQSAVLEKALSVSRLAPSLASLTPDHTLMSSSTTVQISGNNIDAFYKVPVTINSSSTLSNYQVKLSVDTASLIAAGKMRADGGDIRFFDADDNPLVYWVAGPINNSATAIWVTIPSLASGSNTIYLTYGNLFLSANNATGNETAQATSTSVSLGAESGGSRIYFGGVEATDFKVISSSTISVVSPVHSSGPVDVTLTNLDGQSSTLIKGFSYYSDRYVITTAALNLRESQPGLVSIQSQDINGNVVVVATDTVFTLSSSAASGFFARNLTEDSATRWNYSSVVIPAGQSGVSFYYKDNQKGSPILTVTPPANEGAPLVTQTETITSRFRLLVTGISSPIKAGSPSSLTVQAIDYNGQPLADYTGKVHFTMTDAMGRVPADFMIKPSMLGNYTFVNGVTFVTVGTWCVTVTDTSDANITGSQCNISAIAPNAGTPNHLKIVTDPQFIATDGISAPITIQLQDVDNNPAIFATTTPLYIYSDSTSTQLSLDGVNFSSAPLATTIPTWISSVNVYLQDAAIGEHHITVADDAVSGQDFGLANDSQTETTGVGEPYRFVMMPTMATSTAGAASGVLSVGMQDSVGNTVSATRNRQVMILPAAGKIATSTDGTWSDKLSLDFSVGQSAVHFYYKQTQAGTFSIVVSDTDPANGNDGIVDALAQVTVRAASPSKIIFKNSEQELVAGQTSDVFSFGLVDEYGNPAISSAALPIYLSTNRSGSHFSTTANFATETSAVIIPADNGSAAVYFRQTQYVPYVTITASDKSGSPDGDAGLSDATQIVTITPGALTKFNFSSLPASVVAGAASLPFEVRGLNNYDVAIPFSSQRIYLRSTSLGNPVFATSSDMAQPISYLDVTAGDDKAVFYYEDNKSNTFNIIAGDEASGADAGIINASASFSVIPAAPDHLTFLTASQTLNAGEISGMMTLGLADRFQNLTAAVSPFTISLKTDASSGAFAATAGGPFNLETITIPANESVANYYYRDVASGTPVITASTENFGSNNQTETINWGSGQSIHLSASSTDLTAGSVSGPITIAVANKYGITIPLNADWNFSLTAQPVSSSQIVKTAQDSFTYSGTAAGTTTITASLAGLTAGTLSLSLQPAAVSQLVFTNPARTIELGEKSETLKIQAQDQYGNQASLADNLILNLHTDSLAGHFIDVNGQTISQITLPAAAPLAELFYQDLTVGYSVLAATNGSLTGSQTINVINGAVRGLRLSTVVSTLTPNQISNAITLETLNAHGQTVPTASDLTVYLSATDGQGAFATSTSGPFNLTSLTIPSGSSSWPFYFQDSTVGSLTVRSQLDKEQLLTITNSNDHDLTDYTLAANIDTQSLIAAGALRADGNDLRFFDRDGATNIPYWIESGLNSTSTRVWLKVPYLSRNSERLIIMSYGDSGRAAASNQSAVFPNNDNYPTFTGWTNNTGWSDSSSKTSCGAINMYGGYNRFGAGSQARKTYANLPAGQYQITFNYYQLDSWDGEAGRLTVDGNLVWQRHHTASGSNVCGNGYGDSGLYYAPVTITVNHAAGDMDLLFDSTLDESSDNESWGLDHISVRQVASNDPTVAISPEAADLDLVITAGQPYRLNLASPATMSADGASPVMSAQIFDEFGNITSFASSSIINLNTSATTTGQFATTTSGTWGINSIVLDPGVSAFTFYYRDPLVGAKTLALSANGLVGAEKILEVTPGAITHFVFTSDPQNLAVLATSSAIKVRALDKNNNIVKPSSLVLHLNSSSDKGEFSSALTPWQGITSLNWPADADTVIFYYKDGRVGTSTLSVVDSNSSYQAATQSVVLYSTSLSALSYNTSSQTVVTGTPSAPVSISLLDGAGNLVATNTPLTISLNSNSATAEFSASLDNPDWRKNLDLTVSAGATAARFYFRDSAVGTMAITASASGFNSIIQDENVIIGTPDHLTISVASSTPAETSLPVDIKIFTSDNRPIAVTSNTSIALSSSPSGSFSLSNDNWQPITSFNFVPGQAEQSLYFRSQIAGPAELKATAQPANAWTDGQANVEILPLNIYQLKVLSGPDTFNVHNPSTVLVAQTQDQYGNVTSLSAVDTAGAGSLPIYLYGSGEFATSTAGTWGISSVPLNLGENTFSFYYRSSALGTQTITVSEEATKPTTDTGWVNGSWIVKVSGDTAANIVFSSPPRTIKAGDYGEITIQAVLADASPAILEKPIVIVLGNLGDSGSFTLSTSSPSTVTSLNIPSGQSSVTLYAFNSQVGTYTFTAAATGYQPISQALTVIAGAPNRLAFVNAPQNITAGQDSQAYHLQIQDAYGNVVALSTSTNINLQASDSGSFSLATGNDWSATSSIPLSAGTSDAYFYYRSHNSVGSYEVRAADAGGMLGSSQQNVVITAAAVSRLSIVSAPFSIAKGQVSPAVSLIFYDQYGNSRVLAAPTSLYLYSSGQGSFSKSSDFSATTSTIALPAGVSGASFFYKDRASGTPTITVSDMQPLEIPDSGLANAVQSETIVEGVPTSLNLSIPASIPAGNTAPLSLQLYNQYGEPAAATSSVTVYLDSSSAYGRFSTSTNFSPSDFITSYNFSAGQTSQTIYYRDTLSGAATLLVSDVRPLDNPDSGLANSSSSITVLPADLYSFTFLSAPQTLEAGQPSSAMAIEARDVYGNVKAVPADTALYFYSSSTPAAFSSSSDFAATTTYGVIPAGANGLNFYYRDLATGTPTITVSDKAVLDVPDSGIVNAVQSESITPGNIFRIKILSAPQTLEVGKISQAYQVELENRYGAPRAVNNDTVLYLFSASASGQFAISQAGPFNVDRLTIPAGESQTDFYYRQLAAGSAILTVSDASPADGSLGMIDDSQSVEMNAGQPVQLAIASSPTQVIARHTSNAISVVLLNQSGYQTVSSSTLRFYLRSSSADGTSEFATSPQGPWGINYFDLAPDTSQFTLYYRSTQLGDQNLTIADELPITTGVGLVDAIGSIKVVEQSLDHFLVTNIADPQIQGTPSTVVVMAKDAADFIYSQYQGKVCFSASDYYTILPACYTFLPSDYGMVSLNNSVAFMHSGEKTVFATDDNGITGMQNNITVVANNSGFLAKLKFSNVSSSIALQRGQAYGPLTVQLFDDNDQPVNAPSGGYNIRLSASSASGLFSLSASGPWSSTLVTTIPAGLSSVNVYYKDSSSGESLVMASDWQSGVDDAHIANANLTTVTSGLVINSTKKLESHNAGTLALTENKSLFLNDSLLDTLEGQGSFAISVADDVSGQGVPVSLQLSLLNARGEVYQANTATTTADGTYTYDISSIKAKVPDDSGDWNLSIKAQAADGRRGEILVPVAVSGWRGVLNYSLGYVKQGSPLTVGVSLYNNGVLSDAPDFRVEWLDKSGHIVSGATPLTKSQMTRFQTGEYYGNLTTNSGLSEGEKYHALLIVNDTDSSILAEDSHGDIQISNNPAMAPKNFQVEKILTSTPPAPETYDLKFSWDVSNKATSYSLYRTQDKFARLFSNPCTIAEVQSGARASGTCESLINMDEDPTDDTTHWVKEATLPFANITSYTLKDAQNLTGDNYFFLVRASNGLQESGLSSMLFVAKHPFNYNSTAGATNYNWFSMPYNLTSFTNAAAGLAKAVLNKPSLIVADIEGGLGLNNNRKINAIALWDSLTQNITSVYRYRSNPFNKWTGVDFTILPGAGMYLQSSGLTNPFTWTVLGADTKIVHNFSYNSSSSATNYNWVSLPYSGMYKKASDVVNDIEGGLGTDTDQKINVIALWDSSSQNINSIYRYRGKPFNKWTGVDFGIKPGDGIYLQTSGLTSNFSWTPALLVEPNQ